MALIMTEGFTWGQHLLDAQTQTLVENSPAWADAPYSGKFVQHASNGEWHFMSGDGTPTTSGVIGMRMKFGKVNLFHTLLFEIFDQQVIPMLSVASHGNGDLQVYSGTTVHGVTSNLQLHAYMWNYIELKYTCHDTAGSFELRVNGVNVLEDNTINTTMHATLWDARGLHLNSHSTPEAAFCDMYWLDQTGGVNDDFLGDVHVETLKPAADGNQNDFTRDSGSANYEMVDQVGIEMNTDPDDTFNEGSAVGDAELYTVTPLTVTADTVYGVVVKPTHKMTMAGTRQIRALIRSNTDEAEGVAKSVGISYRTTKGVFDVDPQGSGAWTEARVNALETGVTIES